MSDTPRTKTVKLMTCAYCNRAKPWTDAFPSSIEACCWDCFWKHHVETNHKPGRRRWWAR